MNMSRGNAGRGAHRGMEPRPDGRAGTKGTAPKPQPSAGHLSQFGSISRPTANAPMSFGPSSVFNKKNTRTSKREMSPPSHASRTNAFSLLAETTAP
jgi:hypothetical protein